VSERDDAVRPGREAHRLVDVETPLGAIYRREAVEPWRYQDLRDLFEQVAANRALGLIGHGAIADALKPDPADLPRVTDAIRAAVSTGQPYDLEYRVRHADGTTRWIEDRGCVSIADLAPLDSSTPRHLASNSPGVIRRVAQPSSPGEHSACPTARAR